MLWFENINTGMHLDYKQQKEKLKHFHSMLGVVKVNKQQLFTLKTDISAKTFWEVIIRVRCFTSRML